ncbi:hypothetical protein PRIPAC_80829 [Pristionchus pacificus]|uniref:Uncharacterized protein n=1 Tax=Pristionchus pacificus TaxID=54126 RepID=A0A2A6C2V6_PRIPA|nr:hypothetical protein PRIPAC_80829 [Pristionchus pacificus]|eukprot:PDM72476.1 hypothetical protein PRIPAC_38910 [Pristionchus pacificus]
MNASIGGFFLFPRLIPFGFDGAFMLIALCFDQIMTDEELIYTVDIHAPEYSAFSSEMIGTLTKVAIKKRSITGYKNVLDSPATPGIALNIITSPLQSSIFTILENTEMSEKTRHTHRQLTKVSDDSYFIKRNI